MNCDNMLDLIECDMEILYAWANAFSDSESNVQFNAFVWHKYPKRHPNTGLYVQHGHRAFTWTQQIILGQFCYNNTDLFGFNLGLYCWTRVMSYKRKKPTSLTWMESLAILAFNETGSTRNPTGLSDNNRLFACCLFACFFLFPPFRYFLMANREVLGVPLGIKVKL